MSPTFGIGYILPLLGVAPRCQRRWLGSLNSVGVKLVLRHMHAPIDCTLGRKAPKNMASRMTFNKQG